MPELARPDRVEVPFFAVQPAGCIGVECPECGEKMTIWAGRDNAECDDYIRGCGAEFDVEDTTVTLIRTAEGDER